MLKGFALYFILSMLTRNPFLALILLFVIYAVADKAYFGFLPDFIAPFKRNSRIKTLLAELELNPANADSAQELGVLYFEKRNYNRALQFLKKANEKVFNSPRLYLYMGMAYMELNRSTEGKQALDQAVGLDRKVGHGLPYIYLLQYELKRSNHFFDEIKVLEEGLGSFASAENFYRMGVVYKKQGDRQKARHMFECAIQEYSYVPKRLRRIHRKWAVFSWINRL